MGHATTRHANGIHDGPDRLIVFIDVKSHCAYSSVNWDPGKICKWELPGAAAPVSLERCKIDSTEGMDGDVIRLTELDT